jgi:hypothetical protein
MKAHDTKGLIERTASAFVREYITAGRERFPQSKKADIKSFRLWMIKEYAYWIHFVMSDEDRVWFREQRPNYRSTLRWKIMIEAFSSLSRGR